MITVNLNYDFKSDEKALEWVDSLYIKYDMPHGYKSDLKSLVLGGIVEVEESKAQVIEHILKLEGF